MTKSVYGTALAFTLGLMSCRGPTDPSSLSTTEDFIARLRDAQASVHRVGQVEGFMFSVTGTVLAVNDSRPRVTVYELPTPDQAADEAARVVRGTVVIEWVATPHIYRAGRLAVIYVGISPTMRHLLDRILGAPVYSDSRIYDSLSGS